MTAADRRAREQSFFLHFRERPANDARHVRQRRVPEHAAGQQQHVRTPKPMRRRWRMLSRRNDNQRITAVLRVCEHERSAAHARHCHRLSNDIAASAETRSDR